MTSTTYTLNQIAEIMAKNKWYLLATEEAVTRFLKNGYGTVTVKYDLRNSQVEKVSVIGTEETVLKPTENRPNSVRSDEAHVLTMDIFKF